MSQLTVCIIILIATILLFLSGKFPMGLCGMFCALALLVTGILTPQEAFAGFSNTNLVIMVSMMIISAGLMKTSLIDRIMKLVSRVGGESEQGIIIGFGLILILLVQFMNGFAALACMIPFITGMCEDSKVSPSKVYFPLMIIAMSWLTLFPIAAGLSILSQMNGYLEMYNSPVMVGIWDMAIARLPGTVLATLFAVFILPKMCPAEPHVDIKGDLGQIREKKALSGKSEILAYVITIVTVSLMITNTLHKIPIYTIAAVGAFLMVFLRVLSEKECIASVSWGTVFMFAGILPLATALDKTGASTVISDLIVRLLGGSTHPLVISAVFGFLAWILTQFMSNGAVAVVFWALTAMISVNLKMNPIGIMNLVYLAATAGFASPMAAPGVPLTMAAGGYNLKDCMKLGTLPGLILIVTGVIWCAIIFPAY